MIDVILVDEYDNEVGVCEKLLAHQNGSRHRAISVVGYRLINGDIEVLLQQRAKDKYHCAGLWANTCCSHPYPNEAVSLAANRRLQEEMGLSAHLDYVGWFNYQEQCPEGLIENENDHVFICNLGDQTPQPNKEEVSDFKWVNWDEAYDTCKSKDFAPWFSHVLFYLADQDKWREVFLCTT